MSKSVLIISYSDLNTDPRVLRQIRALGGQYRIITAGLGPSNLPLVSTHIKLNKFDDFQTSKFLLFSKVVFSFYNKIRSFTFLKALKFYELYYWDSYRRKSHNTLSKLSYDVIIANDADALPLATSLKNKSRCKILFDAHEYSPLEFEENEKWKRIFSPYYLWLCKKYIKEADYCTTVSYGLAKAYEKLSNRKFSLIYNAPEFVQILPEKPKKVLKFVHHGAAIPARNLELMVQVFANLSKDFELHLILVKNSPSYFQEIYTLAKPYTNIFFHEPVPTKQIPSFLNQFDIGIFLLPPVNFNYRFALPNKFFEFVQARLMILIGPSPEMQFFVDNFSLGVVTEDFDVDKIVGIINKLDWEDVFNYKLNADKAAKELSGDKSIEEIKKIIANLV